jgi:hypothetical protein
LAATGKELKAVARAEGGRLVPVKVVPDLQQLGKN